MRLIPAIDLRGGRCVRLRQGNYDAESVFAVEPLQLLERYRGWGADWVHVVDLDAARDGSTVNAPVIAALAAQSAVHLQVGGGLRSRARVSQCLATGIDRAVIGSLAISAPDEVAALIRDFGADRITIALDVRLDDREVPRVATHGWRKQTAVPLWEAVETASTHGVSQVLCTDVARDGMLAGPNFDLYQEGVRRYPGIAWQASGGIRNLQDLETLARLGVAAAVSGRALLDDLISPQELRPFLPNA
jgi:phosphoribosylformimino-5-aminoimidazole carboxamide ribotide isomerase